MGVKHTQIKKTVYQKNKHKLNVFQVQTVIFFIHLYCRNLHRLKFKLGLKCDGTNHLYKKNCMETRIIQAFFLEQEQYILTLSVYPLSFLTNNFGTSCIKIVTIYFLLKEEKKWKKRVMFCFWGVYCFCVNSRHQYRLNQQFGDFLNVFPVSFVIKFHKPFITILYLYSVDSESICHHIKRGT